jgi:predicted nuclease of predicted toxin-antitoxin system
MNKTRKILIAEGVFVLGVFVYIFLFANPSQIYPLQGMIIKEPDLNFEFKNAEEILISTDKNFVNQIILKKNEEILLEPGIYFWKVRNKLKESEIRNFTIEEVVAINLKETGEFYELQNVGTVNLNITKIGERNITDITIDIGDSEFFEKDNSTYEGRMK